LIVFDFPKEIKEPLFSEIAAPATQNNNINSDLPIINRESFRSILSEDKQDVKAIGPKAVDFFTLLGEQEVDFRHCVLNGNNFRINVNCYLGSSVLDLRNENLDGKNIDIFVNNIFGEIKIYIPPGGIVHQNLQITLGNFSIKDKRKSWLKRILGIVNK
jgi:predicted membrane protein